jgi:hypothetical protein
VRLSQGEIAVSLEGERIATHRRSFVPADVVLDPAHARALRLARAVRRRLGASDVVVPVPDLSRYDAVVGLS